MQESTTKETKKSTACIHCAHWRARTLTAETIAEKFLDWAAEEGRCRVCGDEIWWLKFRSGTKPINADLSPHPHSSKELAKALKREPPRSLEHTEPSSRKYNQMKGLLRYDKTSAPGVHPRKIFYEPADPS